jgi:hypothetical protein
VKAKTVKEVLTAVEWMLTHIGWTQGISYRDGGGISLYRDPDNIPQIKSMCLGGAFDLVEVENNLLRTQAICHFNSVNYILNHVRFNDSPNTTKNMVIAALRKAREAQ